MGLFLLVGAYFARLAILPIALLYFVVFHRLLGQTPGKWLLGIRVESVTGGRISWKAALVRFALLAWGPLAWLALAGLVFAIHGDDHATLTVKTSASACFSWHPERRLV